MRQSLWRRVPQTLVAAIYRTLPLEMPLHLWPCLQRRGVPGGNLGNALGREVHVDKAGRSVGDLMVLRDSAVAQLHDGDALEHRARSLSLG